MGKYVAAQISGSIAQYQYEELLDSTDEVLCYSAVMRNYVAAPISGSIAQYRYEEF
jgi:hypothetical protein